MRKMIEIDKAVLMRELYKQEKKVQRDMFINNMLMLILFLIYGGLLLALVLLR